jgi:RND family efflux transporter MFP subunit
MNMRRFFLPVALAALVFATSLPGCRRSAPSEENASLAPVKVVPAETVELAEWIDLVAATQPLPDKAARITVIIPGRVSQVLQDAKGKPIVEGQLVGKDQVVAQLDDRIARAQRDKMLAMIEELQEAKKQADLAQKLAQLDLDRLQKLFPANRDVSSIPLVSKIEIEKARLLLQDSKLKQKAAQAKEKSLREELKSLDVQLEYHELRAPIRGYLGTLHVSPGQSVNAGTIVAEVIDLDAIEVVAYASPRAADRIKFGQSARLLVKDQTDPDKDTLQGSITYVAVQAQPDTGNFLVKARFDNKGMRYRANQIVRLDVQVQEAKKRLVVPQAALFEDHDPPFTVIAQDKESKKNKDGESEAIGKARRVFAYPGVRDRVNQKVEILRLEDPEKKEAIPVAGAEFIVEGGHGLRTGDALKIEEARHP